VAVGEVRKAFGVAPGRPALAVNDDEQPAGGFSVISLRFVEIVDLIGRQGGAGDAQPLPRRP
jgi:hypothetical protein